MTHARRQLPPRPLASSPALSLALALAGLVPFGLALTSFADQLALSSTAPQSDGYFGQSIALIDDLDGDGSADVLVGAPLESVNQLAMAGRVFVFSGRTGGVIRSHVSTSPEVFGHFGWDVVGIGDVNGDGRGDYAIGAPFEVPGDKGRVTAYSGVDGSVLWTKSGSGAATGWGGVLAAVPDLSGDGRMELLIGYAGVTGDGPSVVAYEGKNGVAYRTYTKPAGGGAFHSFGQSVASVADLSGDGEADVLVGAPKWDLVNGSDAGAVFVFNGMTGSLIGAMSSIDSQPGGMFGRSASGVPDLNGDGKGDIVVGAPGEVADGSSIRGGQAHIYSGASRAFLRTLQSSAPIEQGIFGHAVVGTKDLDDDGFGDVLVAAPLEGPGPSYGRVYRFSGFDGSELGPVLVSPDSGSGFGFGLSAAGDITQDGRPDIAVGAPLMHTPSAPAAGRAYLHRLVPNDGCSSLDDVPAIGEGWHYLSTIAAEASEPAEAACSDAAERSFDSDVFFLYSPSATGIATISTCAQSGFDSRLAIYAVRDPIAVVCDLSELLACNDNADACANGGSIVTLPVAQGSEYWIRVGGALGDQGIAGMTVSLEPSCLGDLDANGFVDAADLATLLGQWGGGGIADLNGDDLVNAADLALLLGGWGPC